MKSSCDPAHTILCARFATRLVEEINFSNFIAQDLSPSKPTLRDFRTRLDTALSNLLQLKKRSHAELSTFQEGV